MTDATDLEFPGITPHLVVSDATAAIDFYRQVFDADELRRMAGPDGRLWHAELLIRGGRMLVMDEFPDMGVHSPTTLGGTPVHLHLYVPDVDTLFAQAVAAGATALMEPSDAFWGDRYAQILDPYGHRWSLGHKLADLADEGMSAAGREWLAGHGNPASPGQVEPTADGTRTEEAQLE